MREFTRFLVAILSLHLTSCEDAPVVAMPSSCSSGAVAPVARLSNDELCYTLRDVALTILPPDHPFHRKLVESATPPPWRPVTGKVERVESPEEPMFGDWTILEEVWLPPDLPRSMIGEARGGYTRLDDDLSLERLEGALRLGTALAAELTRPALFASLGCEATSADCRRQIIERAGRLLYRRSLTSVELGDWEAGVAESRGPEVDFDAQLAAQGLSDVLAAMMGSAPFLFHLELAEPVPAISPDERLGPDDTAGRAAPDGEGAIPGGVVSPLALAARLSAYLWASGPDEELIAAAEDGSLATEAGYAYQASRLYADSRARRSLSRFAREWLRLDSVPKTSAHAKDLDFLAFFGGQPDATLDAQIHQEVVDLVLWFFRERPGTATDLLMSNVNLVRRRDLAALYGVEPSAVDWRGRLAMGNPNELPADERAGLLTRIALLSAGAPQTRPIQKGLRVREALLCEPVAPPPDNVFLSTRPHFEGVGTREAVTLETEYPGSPCAGCHSSLINPLGFVTEGYDGMGRVRTTERFWDSNDGTLVAEVPIDTRVEVSIGGEAPVPAATPGELATHLQKSGRYERCLAREVARYALRRADIALDDCLVTGLSDAMRGGATLDQIWLGIVFTPEFKRPRVALDSGR